jgi:putative ABC transport system substrate-binding protein
MRRREFITLLSGAAVTCPLAARAQQQLVRQRHVGVLMTGSSDTGLVMLQALKARLSELGWVVGKTVTFDEVWAEGRLDRFPALAAQLVRHRPDVIVAPTTTAVLAVRQIAPDMPTVFITVADAIGSGLIESYARPGGSTTGIQGNIETLPGKQIELLREIVPAASRIGILVNIPNPSTMLQKRNAEAAAASLGLTLLPISISSPD